MKRILVFLVCFPLFVGVTFGQEKQPDELLKKAIYQEEVKGNLEEAILIYTDIIKKYPEQRAITAEALFHLGLSNEKLGNKKAQEYYETIVNSFGDQPKYVRIAKERLSKLLVVEKVSNIPLIPKFTKINIPTELSSSIQLSPNGKDLVLVSDEKLWKMPVSGNLGPEFSGIPVQINTEGIEVFYTGLSWSGDGKWIAFNENIKGDLKNKGIYIVSSAGGKPNKIVETNRGIRIINYGISLSPDAEKLAFSSIEDKKQYVRSISVDGSNRRQLTDMEAREPVYSPNGKMIAYVEDKSTGKGSGDLGLWVVPTHNGTPHLVANAEKASGPVWSPDSKKIAFLEYNNGKQINIVHDFSDGASPGKVTSIDVPEGIEEVLHFAGWTPDNKIGALLRTNVEYGLYTLPAKGGQPAIVLSEGNSVQPRWSPDSKKIYYINDNDVLSWTSKTLGVVSAEGGIGKLLPVRKDVLLNFPYQYQAGNRISPDGKLIISAASSSKELGSPKFPSTQIWKIPIDGGIPTQITNPNPSYGDFAPSWSPDGNQVAFLRLPLNYFYGKGEDSCAIYTLNIDDRIPKLLLKEKLVLSPVWSPDGKMIAYLADLVENVSSINVVNVINGESRMIAEISGFSVRTDLAWSPDSKSIAFLDNKSKVVKVVSLSEGSMENVKTNLVDVKLYNLDWSPDGKRFVFGGVKDGNKEFWFLEDFLPLENLVQKEEFTEASPKVMTNKKIWDDSDTDLEGAPSPDGKYLSYVDWENGDLAIYEIATGKKRRLTNKGTWDESHDFAEYSIWSPDSKKIAYSWYCSKDDLFELRTIEYDGSNSRILHKMEGGEWGRIYDWTSDGKNILANLEKKDGTIQMVLVSTDDGSVRILKTSALTETGANWPENMRFSPDGQYIVFDLPKFKDSEDRDIFLMSVDEKNEMPIVEHPAIDKVLGWAPDENNIIFVSDRTGSPEVWSIKVQNGKPQGDPVLVKSNNGPFSPIGLGFTNDGSFYYGNLNNRYDIYSTEIDPETGKIAGAPNKLVERFIGSNSTPAYSNDGKYLAYVSRRPPGTMGFTTRPVGNVLCIRSLETGEEKEFRPEINVFGWPRWSPDGHSVIVVNFDGNRNTGYYQIDIQNGKVTPILFPDNRNHFGGHSLSPDGKIFTYGLVDYNISDGKSFNCQIIARNITSGEEEVIYQSEYEFRISPSPDGKFLALLSNDDKRMKILPVTGGEPRELPISEEWKDYKFELRNVSTCWSSDAKYVYVLMKNSKIDDSKWELCRISVIDGKIQKLGLKMGNAGFVNPSVHTDGKHICYSARGISNSEIWVMENFLPKE